MPNFRRVFPVLLLCATLAACSPDYNWRQVQPADATFVALFPAKTVSHTQQVNLDGIRTDMAMTAAEVNGVMFAIGSASLSSAALVQPALSLMRIPLGEVLTHLIRPIRAFGSQGFDKARFFIAETDGVFLNLSHAVHQRNVFKSLNKCCGPCRCGNAGKENP